MTLVALQYYPPYESVFLANLIKTYNISHTPFLTFRQSVMVPRESL